MEMETTGCEYTYMNASQPDGAHLVGMVMCTVQNDQAHHVYSFSFIGN